MISHQEVCHSSGTEGPLEKTYELFNVVDTVSIRIGVDTFGVQGAATRKYIEKVFDNLGLTVAEPDRNVEVFSMKRVTTRRPSRCTDTVATCQAAALP